MPVKSKTRTAARASRRARAEVEAATSAIGVAAFKAMATTSKVAVAKDTAVFGSTRRSQTVAPRRRARAVAMARAVVVVVAEVEAIKPMVLKKMMMKIGMKKMKIGKTNRGIGRPAIKPVAMVAIGKVPIPSGSTRR